MKVLVIGSGGREHAIAQKFKESGPNDEIFILPGNDGMKDCGTLVSGISVEDIDKIAQFAEENKIDMTFVGPEIPLTLGIVDAFNEKNLPIFGPCKRGAELEGSKAFSKMMMDKYNVPTAAYREFTNKAEALKYLETSAYPIVIKADGLAAGKGVIIAEDSVMANAAIEDIMGNRVFGEAGDKVIIEEFLVGEELSVIAFSDGKVIIPMASSQDHKRIFDGDKGPNTGGMGAYSPAPCATEEVMNIVQREVLDKMLWGLKQEGITYKGILYAGIMITAKGPKVLEFNVRFGDPETQVILPRLDTPLIELTKACVDGTLADLDIKWTTKSAIVVVMAAAGYPATVEKGAKIEGLDIAKENGVTVFHAGTVEKDGNFYVNGGRVLGVTALGENLPDAILNAYENGVQKISFTGMQFRTDIGAKGLSHLLAKSTCKCNGCDCN